MFCTPSLPALEAGRPFLQIDYCRARWLADKLSASGLRAWFCLTSYYRNDRAIPSVSTRQLARICGFTQTTACRVLAELQGLVVFSGDCPQEADLPPEPPAVHPKRATEPPAVHPKRTPEPPAVHSEPLAVHPEPLAVHPSLSSKEEIQEGINPPPTSSTSQLGAQAQDSHEEEDGILGVRIQADGWNSQQPDPSPALAAAMQERCLQINPQLEPVREELLAFWAGKEGNRSPLAFAALQGELCRIEADTAGGIEQVREQLSVAAQKGWAFIRHKTWQTWRLAHPEPIHLTEEDLTAGGIYPELAAFERRYRASYNPKASGGEVFGAYWNYTQRLEREQAAPDLQSAT